jgi:hypothetical protein
MGLISLIKLQSYGVTDEEILNIYGFLESARLESKDSPLKSKV